MIYLYSVLGLGGLAALVYAIQSVRAWGAEKYKLEEAQADAKQSQHDAQKYADAKYTRASKRLRALAAAKRKNRS